MSKGERGPRQQGGASSREQQAQKEEDRFAQRNNVGNPARPGEPAPRRGNLQHGDLDDGRTEDQQHAQEERYDEQR